MPKAAEIFGISPEGLPTYQGGYACGICNGVITDDDFDPETATKCPLCGAEPEVKGE